MKKEWVVFTALVLLSAVLIYFYIQSYTPVLTGNAISERAEEDSAIYYRNRALLQGANPEYIARCYDDTKAYWNFDENVYDVVGNEFYNANINGRLNYKDGVVGESLDFPGQTSSYLSINKEAFDGIKKFSVSFWMKTGGTNDGIISVYNDKSINEFVVYDQKRLTLFINGERIRTNIKANNGKWHHVVVSVNTEKREGKIYFDGEKRKDFNLKFGSSINADGVYLGQKKERGELRDYKAYEGQLDEIGIFTRIISEDEIKDMYNERRGFAACRIKKRKEFVAAPYMPTIARSNVPPKEVVANLKEMGATGMVYNCRFLQKQSDKAYFEKFLQYAQETKEIDIYYTIKDDCLKEGNYYSTASRVESLLEKYPAIKGIIFDDYIMSKEAFREFRNLDYDGEMLAIVYSALDNTEKVDLSGPIRMTGYIDYIEARFANDAKSYCGRSDYCPLKSRDHEKGLNMLKDRYPKHSSYAGFYGRGPSYIRIENDEFKKDLEEAQKASPDGYFILNMDFGEDHKDWLDEDARNTNKYPLKYNVVKDFINSFSIVQ